MLINTYLYTHAILDITSIVQESDGTILKTDVGFIAASFMDEAKNKTDKNRTT